MMGGLNPRPIVVEVQHELAQCEACDARNYTPTNATQEEKDGDELGRQSPILVLKVTRIPGGKAFFVDMKLCPSCCVRMRAAIDEAEFSLFNGAPQEVS